MALIGSEGAAEAHQSDDDYDDRIRVAEIEVAAAHFLQKKKNAYRHNDDGAAKAANGATLAVAMKMITHGYWSSRNSLLLAAVHAISEHQNADSDQNHGPKLRNAVPREPVKIVEQKQEARANQQDWANGAIPAEMVERVGQSLASTLGLRGAQRIDRHVDPKSGDADPERSFRAPAHGPVYAGDEENEKNREMDHAFAVLLVIESA